MTRADKLAKMVGFKIDPTKDDCSVLSDGEMTSDKEWRLWNLCLRLMEDKERIDWLSRQPRIDFVGSVFHNNTSGHYVRYGNDSGPFRKAIDRARRKP